MASSSSAMPTFSLFLLCFLALISGLMTTNTAAAAAGSGSRNMTHLHYYFHDITAGPNATSAVVFSLNSTASRFGTGIVFDGPLTEGPEISSAPVGRAQGLAVVVSMEDASMMPMQNHIYHAGPYNGSTIAIFGIDDATAGIADRPVLGGSGQFRMVQGYSIAKVYSSNGTYTVVEFDVYLIKHQN